MVSKSFKASRSNLSQASDAPESQKPPLPPTVTFGRRTSSGHYISFSRDDLDSELGSHDFMNYTVHMPPTPDNQPNGRLLPLPLPSGVSKMKRRLSLMKSTKSALMRSQTGGFDHNWWLFETRGTYGYSNA